MYTNEYIQMSFIENNKIENIFSKNYICGLTFQRPF